MIESLSTQTDSKVDHKRIRKTLRSCSKQDCLGPIVSGHLNDSNFLTPVIEVGLIKTERGLVGLKAVSRYDNMF